MLGLAARIVRYTSADTGYHGTKEARVRDVYDDGYTLYYRVLVDFPDRPAEGLQRTKTTSDSVADSAPARAQVGVSRLIGPYGAQ